MHCKNRLVELCIVFCDISIQCTVKTDWLKQPINCLSEIQNEYVTTNLFGCFNQSVLQCGIKVTKHLKKYI
jgi:hypothetical protein